MGSKRLTCVASCSAYESNMRHDALLHAESAAYAPRSPPRHCSCKVPLLWLHCG